MTIKELEDELDLLVPEFNILKARIPRTLSDPSSKARYASVQVRMNEIVDELARRRIRRKRTQV